MRCLLADILSALSRSSEVYGPKGVSPAFNAVGWLGDHIIGDNLRRVYNYTFEIV